MTLKEKQTEMEKIFTDFQKDIGKIIAQELTEKQTNEAKRLTEIRNQLKIL